MDKTRKALKVLQMCQKCYIYVHQQLEHTDASIKQGESVQISGERKYLKDPTNTINCG